MKFHFCCIALATAVFAGCTTSAMAQLSFTTNNGALTVCGYSGPEEIVVIPSTTNGLPVVAIGDHAFELQASVRSIQIPNSVTAIGTSAFSSCQALTNAALGDSVVTIGDQAFYNCVSLTGIVMPDTTTRIGIATFTDCISMTNITVPGSVTNIGLQAFQFCTSLRAITVEPVNAAYSSMDGVLFNYPRTQLLEYPGGKTGAYAIPATVTNIGACAFMQCDKLSDITIPPGVTQIGYYAFYYCTGLSGVSLPEGVTTIDYLAFCGCTGITNLLIPGSVTTIGRSAFNDCRSLKAIDVALPNPNYSSIAGALLDRDGRTLIQCPAGKTGEYTVPSTVTEISGSAFWGCSGLVAIAIPNGVTHIGDFAFCQCAGLTQLIIPVSVTSFGSYAFDACTYLAGLYFKGDAPAAGYEMFYYATNATVYYLPGTKGWGNTYANRPTAWWVLPYPIFLTGVNFGVQPNGFGMVTSWATNASVVVETCTNLANPQWVALSTNTLQSGTNFFTDADWVNYSSRYYRVRGL